MKINTEKGFTMVELVMYIAGMTVLLIAIGTLIYSMYDFYKDATIGPRVDRVGLSVIDRITKDVRTGVSINTEQSKFGVPTGAISLNAQNDTTLLTKYFELKDGRIIYNENGSGEQFLTPDDLSVSNFEITQINTPISIALKYTIGINYTNDGEEKLKSYSGVAILRHSYE